MREEGREREWEGKIFRKKGSEEARKGHRRGKKGREEGKGVRNAVCMLMGGRGGWVDE